MIVLLHKWYKILRLSSHQGCLLHPRQDVKMERLMWCEPDIHHNPKVTAFILENTLICVQKSLHSNPLCNKQRNYLNKSQPEKTKWVIRNKNYPLFLISCFFNLWILVAEIYTTELQPQTQPSICDSNPVICDVAK